MSQGKAGVSHALPWGPFWLAAALCAFSTQDGGCNSRTRDYLMLAPHKICLHCRLICDNSSNTLEGWPIQSDLLCIFELFWKKIARSQHEVWTVYLSFYVYMCVCVCVYVCMYVCMGYVTPIRLRLLYCPVKWSTSEVACLNSTFLKVNQGDIGFGHLENTTSRKHLDDFSTLSNRK